MKWNYEEHKIAIVSAEEYKEEDLNYLDLELEINYLPYSCVCFSRTDYYEPDVEAILHGKETFFCPFCQELSTVPTLCHGLTNNAMFKTVLFNQIDEMQLMFKSYYYERNFSWYFLPEYDYYPLKKEGFLESIYSFNLVYNEKQDVLDVKFIMGYKEYDKSILFAPYLLSGIEYQKTKEEEFIFNVSKGEVFHLESHFWAENEQSTDCKCDCFYEYDFQRPSFKRLPTTCRIFRHNSSFKEYLWEHISQSEHFTEQVKSILKKK